jgi:hypothetical protein
VKVRVRVRVRVCGSERGRVRVRIVEEVYRAPNWKFRDSSLKEKV